MLKNKIIAAKGDNIKLLELMKAAGQKIDIVYIDPPYGTGRSFTYTDKNDEWVAFMEYRLNITKSILADKWTIFISIDDRQQHHLRTMCNNIFGIENFKCQFIRRAAISGVNSAKSIKKNHDYIICFSNWDYFNGNSEYDTSHYKYNDNDGRGQYTLSSLVLPKSNRFVKRAVFDYTYNGVVYQPMTGQGLFCWRWNKQRMDIAAKMNILKVNSNGILCQKLYRDYTFPYRGEDKHTLVPFKRTTPIDSLFFNEPKYSNESGTCELVKIGVRFDYPKPTTLIRDLIKIVPNNQNAIILDYFAGSGTTAVAVAQLNNEDDGSRVAIVCTLDEPYIPNPSKDLNDYNGRSLNIFDDVMLRRIKLDNEAQSLSMDIEIIDLGGDKS